ncbi:MAG: PstS family phosphate ABC transporter substrate-binding protein [Gemmatimonadota bacterium]|nr:PstS family phosphate ABC transporter substrate-binding protein [Gemmatimonadota bacterium]
MIRTPRLEVTALLMVIGLGACGGDREGAGDSGLSGSIQADGSSTVFPITEAVAEEFMAETGGDVRVTVALSGTGGGFKRFCTGETAISNASRPIEESEREVCAQNGVEVLELEIAWDGLAVLVNPANSFVQCLTVEELKRIWNAGSTLRTWQDVRPEWPAQDIKLYGPGTNSGTFDYFTEVINGEGGATRADYTASEDDNVLVQGVAGDASALGYFGYAYLAENRGQLKAVAVDGGEGCVMPTPETIESGAYAPLSRPLYIYVNRAELQRPEVEAFVDFYLANTAELSEAVGYIPLGPRRTQAAREAFQQAANATS